jgi:peroxiredoxin
LLAATLLSSCALHTRTPTIAVGQPAPDFALPDADGKVWELAEMVADGPAVVVFYRGYW